MFTWKSTEEADFKCSLDGQAYESCSKGMSGKWNKDNIRHGSHRLSVFGEDAVGNVGRPTTHRWMVGKLS